MKFQNGTKVEVKADLSFKGLTGVVYWSDKNEDGDIEYLLKDINCPKIIDKNGKEFKINKSFFYEDWLKIINQNKTNGGVKTP